MYTLCQAEQAVKKTEVYLSAGGTEAILVRPDSMPAEATDLVSTGAGEEVDVIDLQRLHTQRALHQVVLHPRVPGHPTITHYWFGPRPGQERELHWDKDKQQLSYILRTINRMKSPATSS